MLLKIGELAKHTGLTVRTLHHYDALGLLSASVRSAAGYRLYNRDDVTRLYRILALRQIGLSLADIQASLSDDGAALPELIERQLQSLERQSREIDALRTRLQWLQARLQRGDEPALADWLTTLEQMTVYSKYFNDAELKELEARKQDAIVADVEQAWPALIAEVRTLMAAATPPADPAAQAAAERWGRLVDQFTGGNPTLLIKSAQMMRQEESVRQQAGIDPAMLDFIVAAMAAKRLGVYARYLDEAEMQRMRAHYGKNPRGWLPLIAEVRQMLNDGADPHSEAARQAAVRWEALTREFAGEDPATRAKLRAAMDAEPAVLLRTGVDAAMLAFIREAGAAAVA
jgi:DNA-binding transcriptional MerR regulator